MSAGTPGEDDGGERAPAQDPWSQPADFGQPASAPVPPAAETGSLPEAPQAWSAPAPASWSSPAQPDPAPSPPPAQAAIPPQRNGSAPPAPPPGAADASAPPAYGPSGGYAWVDPWTGLPTARYQPPPGQAGYQWGYAPRNNPLAIAALVCGIAQLLGFIVLLGNILLAIPAVICGAIALRQIGARGERGRGMAIAGLVLGIIGIVLFVLFLGLLILGLVYARRSS